MANELMETNTFKLEFKPAVLEIRNYDEMKELVTNYSEKYKNLVFDPKDKKGLTQARSELLALKTALDTERKNVKSEYNKPLDEFETLINDLTGLIDEPLEKTREGIAAIDEIEKQAREKALNDLLERLTKDTGVSIGDIEKDARWLNKGNWTSKLEPKGKFEAEVENAVKAVIEEKERRETEKRVLEEFCKAQGIDPAGWVSQLEHRNAMEVIELINLDKQRREKLEAEQKEKAAAREAEQERLRKEYEEAMANNQQAKDEADLFVEDLERNEPKFTPMTENEHREAHQQEPLITNTIQVEGTRAQLLALNEYLKGSGIKVKQVG